MADLHVEVAVVGAGPAGGHLARMLAARGVHTLLVDRLGDLRQNAFSSAGTVMEAMDRYHLPDQVVGSRWRSLQASSNQAEGAWTGTEVQGTVLDFGNLRTHLAASAQAAGADLLLGARATGFTGGPGSARLELEGADGRLEVRARVLVDATGPARSLMRCAGALAPEFLLGVGLEYLVEVPPEVYARYRETLAFFLGTDWIPRGYSWIFPMEEGLLKVGAGRYTARGGGDRASLQAAIQTLLQHRLGLPTPRVLDIHGGVLRYARGLRDPYFAGPVLAIGDAVSTINPLGGEGIRHALEGAEIALPHVLRELAAPGRAGPAYARAMRRRFRRTWLWSERLAYRRYLEDSDDRLDRMIRFLAAHPLEFVVDVLFGYNFPRAARAAGPAWLRSRLRRAVQGLAGGGRD